MIPESIEHRFRTIGNKTGWEILRGEDEDKLALLQLAGDDTADGLDRIAAEEIVSEPQIRQQIEGARVRNTRPLPTK